MKLDLVPLGGPLPGGAENAQARWSERRGLGVVLTSSAGARGFGEASPLPGYSPDTLAEAEAWLRGRAGDSRSWSVATDERRSPPQRLGDLLEDAAALVGSEGPPSARFALEAAFLELAAVEAGRELAAVLATPDAAPQVSVQHMVDHLDPEAAARLAATARHVKVKVGRPGRFAEEQAVLRAVRAALPPGGALRVDVNQAFGPDELPDRLAALADLGVDAVEEPGPPAAVDTLSASPVPLVLDESLRGPGALARAVRLTEAGVVVGWALKPAVLGGLVATLEWVRAARAAGAWVSVGHLFDGPVAQRAYLALARAVGSGPHGLAPHPGLAALVPTDPVQGGLRWPRAPDV
ncbi:MAG: hypothetical protein KC933_34465 [Myxococcales bacterium]|nr:hypothetical protein [Myxococcales bacterium]MCB9645904.1 hypothetical protein [Deltaproteobacteria bacterium]